MQISLSSGDYNIADSGQVFLFGEDKDLTIHVSANDGFHFSLRLEFSKDSSGNQAINQEIMDDVVVLSCLNFQNNGTGLISPVKIAEIEGREMFLIFWSYLEGGGERKVRSVKYTLFYKK